MKKFIGSILIMASFISPLTQAQESCHLVITPGDSAFMDYIDRYFKGEQNKELECIGLEKGQSLTCQRVIEETTPFSENLYSVYCVISPSNTYFTPSNGLLSAEEAEALIDRVYTLMLPSP